MAKLRTGQKVDRVVGFLMGLRHPRIAGVLAHHGFVQEDLDQGWTLLRSVVGERLNAAPPAAPDPDTLDRLDKWENRWFPIARATLAHRYPAVRDAVFRNLDQTDGPEVVISVGTFLERLAGLEDAGDKQTAARRLLGRRGLTAETVAEAKALIDKLRSVEAAPAFDLAATRAAQEEGESAMWAWYLEWSTIARTVIRDGRLLRRLGFRRRGSAARSVADEPSADEPSAGDEAGEAGSPEPSADVA